MPKQAVMIDTNIFNRIVEGKVGISAFRDCDLVATHVQFDELKSTPDEAKRQRLLFAFRQIDPKAVPTESAVWDVSAWDSCKWSTDETCQTLFDAIQREDGKARPMNQWRDALIAETALKNGLTLLSDDARLCDVFRSLGGNAIGLSQYLKQSDSVLS